MRLTENHERLLIGLIALHSTMVGTMFLLLPQYPLKTTDTLNISQSKHLQNYP